MRRYGHHKFRTIREITGSIENWPTAIALRLFRKSQKGMRLLSFRDGLNVMVRAGEGDWSVLHEIIFARSYGKAFDFLKQTQGDANVLDLGGNIGLFALACAQKVPQAKITSFEPGPPNQRMFEINRLVNPELGSRMELRRQAVGGTARIDNWFFDEARPGASSLFATTGQACRVEIAAFKDVVAAMPKPIALVKIDIEGAEYELLDETPAESWREIQTISLELHDDPRGKMSQQAFLDRMRALGFTVEEESVITFFLHR